MKLEKGRLEKSPKKGKKPDFHRKEPVVSRWAKRLAVTALLGTAALFSKNVDAEKKKDKIEQVDTKDANQPIPKLPSLYDLKQGNTILFVAKITSESKKKDLELIYELYGGSIDQIYYLEVGDELYSKFRVKYNAGLNYPSNSAIFLFKDGELKPSNPDTHISNIFDVCEESFGIKLDEKYVENYINWAIPKTDDVDEIYTYFSIANDFGVKIDTVVLNECIMSDEPMINNLAINYLSEHETQFYELSPESHKKLIDTFVKFYGYNQEYLDYGYNPVPLHFYIYGSEENILYLETEAAEYPEFKLSTMVLGLGETAIKPILDSLANQYKEIEKIYSDAEYDVTSYVFLQSSVFGIATLVRFGSIAEEYMLDAITDENVAKRLVAAIILGKIQSPGSIDALIKALDDEEPAVRDAVIFSLSNIKDKKVVVALSKKLKDKNPDIRKASAHALGNIGDPDSIDDLGMLLNDDDPEVRLAAVDAFFMMGFEEKYGEKIVPKLIKVLDDENLEVRLAALDAVLPHVYVNEDAKKVVLNIIDVNPTPDICNSIIQYFGSRDFMNEKEMNFFYETAGKFIKHKDWEVREATAETLGYHQLPASLNLLIELIDDKNSKVRLQAVESIFNAYDGLVPSYKQKAKFYLMKAAEDKNKKVSDEAKEILEIYEDDGIEAIPKNFI